MPRFFTDKIDGERAFIEGADASHIALSLRMKAGENVILCKDGTDYLCRLESITPQSVECRVLESKPCAAEADIKLRLFQAVPKGEKAEIIVQKAVELGVYDISFVLTQRCISRPDEKSFSRKLVRYNKISLEAAKQSGRGIIPQVGGMLDLAGAADELLRCDKAVWCYEKGGISMAAQGLKGGQTIGLLIGSEGGFSESEAEYLCGRGLVPVGLGTRILRCETAPLAAAAIIMNLTGNM